MVTSVGVSLDLRYDTGNRYYVEDTLHVMLIIFMAQLEYRLFKSGCHGNAGRDVFSLCYAKFKIIKLRRFGSWFMLPSSGEKG